MHCLILKLIAHNKSYRLVKFATGTLSYKDLCVCSLCVQHFQLLLQTFVLCRCESSLLLLSQVAAQAIEELQAWSQGAEQGECVWGATWGGP